MTHPTRIDPALCASLVPLNALKPESLADLLRKAQLQTLPRGQTLFKIGDDARAALYLLKGEVHLLDAADKALARVVGGEASGQHRLAHQSPRRVTARCVTEVEVLTVDAGLLDVMLTWDQTGAIEVSELGGGQDSDDWMAKLLQIRTPTLMLQNRDDPFMTPETLPRQEELGPAVTLEVSEYGGHVGFINHGPQRYWLEQRLMAFVQGFGFR